MVPRRAWSSGSNASTAPSRRVGRGTTNADGRCPELTEGLQLDAGTYRLHFETGAYFARTATPTFYPWSRPSSRSATVAAHYHVPLLLSPFGYSTYRGS